MGRVCFFLSFFLFIHQHSIAQCTGATIEVATFANTYTGTGGWANDYVSSVGDCNAGNGDQFGLQLGSLGGITGGPGGATDQFWGMQDIDGNCGSSTGETLTFNYTIPAGVTYTQVDICFDYTVDGYDSGDDIFATINVNNTAPCSDVDNDQVVDGNSNLVIPWTTHCYTIAVSPGDLVELELRIDQNGGTDYGGIDNVTICESANTTALSCGPALICPSAGDLFIAEILYNPSGTETLEEWFEVCNSTALDIDMNGFEIGDSGATNHTIASSLVVPAGGCIVIAHTSVCGATVTPDYTHGSFALSNTADEVEILCNGTTIDIVSYGTGFPSEGNGESIQLLPGNDATTNDDGANWCVNDDASVACGSGDFATPGMTNVCSCSIDIQDITVMCNGINSEITVTYTSENDNGSIEIDVNNNGYQTLASGVPYIYSNQNMTLPGAVVTVRDATDNTCMDTGTIYLEPCCVNCNTPGTTSIITDAAAFGVSAASSSAAGAMNDAYEAEEAAMCSSGSLTNLNFGTFSTPSASGEGTVSGLMTTAGTSCTADYYYMNRVMCPESFDPTNPAAWGTGVDGGLPTSSLQGGAIPDDLDGLSDFSFSTAGSGTGSQSAVVVCFNCAVTEFSVWLGDVEGTTNCTTGDSHPAQFFVWDAAGSLISCQDIPTATANQAGCTGSTNNSTGFAGCGNTETVWVNATGSSIACFGVQVGEFCGTPSFSEHLSLGGLSIGGTCAAIVPVDFLSFDADKKENGVALRWATASEINNEYFVIQHSTDGRSFEDIAYIEGSGTTTETQYYQFDHNAPAEGNNYYRLKQIDYDGSFDYSEIRQVSFGRAMDEELSLYPTVFQNEIYVKSTIASSSVELKVYTFHGQLVYTQKVNDGTVLDLSQLQRGTYIAQLQRDNKIATHKIIKM